MNRYGGWRWDKESWVGRLSDENISGDVHPGIGVGQCEARDGLLLGVWTAVLLHLMRFDIDVCVVGNVGDMVGLPVWCVEWKFVDHDCDVCGGDVEVGKYVYGENLMPSVVSGDVVKVVLSFLIVF